MLPHQPSNPLTIDDQYPVLTTGNVCGVQLHVSLPSPLQPWETLQPVRANFVAIGYNESIYQQSLQSPANLKYLQNVFNEKRCVEKKKSDSYDNIAFSLSSAVDNTSKSRHPH